MISIDDFEARRREIIKMLQTYKDERVNISRLRKLAESELNDHMYPPATNIEREPVQTSFNSGEAGESMIRRASVARKYLKETMTELQFRSDTLDKLLLEITKLPAYQGRVVVGLYIDGKSETDIGEDMNKSDDTICGYRKAAIRRLARTVTGERIRTWKNQSSAST